MMEIQWIINDSLDVESIANCYFVKILLLILYGYIFFYTVV
jgi:hypothetical protein